MTRRFMLIYLLGALLVALSIVPVHAAGNVVLQSLIRGNVYVSPLEISNGDVHQDQLSQLDTAVADAKSRGITEKIAILHKIPYAHASQAASALRNQINLSGVLVLIYPKGLGVSSDKLSRSELNDVARKAAPTCISVGFVACSVTAGKLAVDQIKSNESSSALGGIIFLVIVVFIIGGIIFLVVRSRAKRRKRVQAQMTDLRQAADNTLAVADESVNQIEAAGKMAPDIQQEYERGVGLREQAETELKQATSPAMLTQANQDAAQAVLALQGVMKHMGLTPPQLQGFDTPARKCFYCGRDDQAPYTEQTIADKQGNEMKVDVCTVCDQKLKQGHTPQIVTQQYNGAPMPWWAVPGNPYYYAYGGPTWQYWLPFMIGMDVGGWYGGGWNSYGGYGYGQSYSNFSDNSSGGTDFGSADANPSDAGGVDFGSWDSGNTDSGGGDIGGGDFGGGDSGGGGDWG